MRLLLSSVIFVRLITVFIYVTRVLPNPGSADISTFIYLHVVLNSERYSLIVDKYFIINSR